jgi:2-polyprenyl-3-methyl-5-hydroxy-6-metoxy-1,4-benzoquinol methylase
VVISALKMGSRGPASPYALGNTEAEHERLVRQAERLAPGTERLFREAGIGAGQRVLDLGSGVGDVAMLAARLVGSSGEVLGVERDSRSIARARTRVRKSGFNNVSFTECDVSQLESSGRFDAVVGRFILQFIPNPQAVLRDVSLMIRPGGVFAFQEITYAPLLALSQQLPLWSATVSLARETVRRCGANTEMGPALHRVFQEAGLPAPTMRMEVLLGSDPDFALWIYDLLRSLEPQVRRHCVSLESLGDFETLPARLLSELAGSKTVLPYVAFVGAWCHKPADETFR